MNPEKIAKNLRFLGVNLKSATVRGDIRDYVLGPCAIIVSRWVFCAEFEGISRQIAQWHVKKVIQASKTHSEPQRLAALISNFLKVWICRFSSFRSVYRIVVSVLYIAAV